MPRGLNASACTAAGTVPRRKLYTLATWGNLEGQHTRWKRKVCHMVSAVG